MTQLAEKPFKATVNEQVELNVLPADAQKLDIIPLGNGVFHLLKNEKAYRAELIHADYTAKTFTLAINGNRYRVALGDRYDQLVKSLGLDKNSAQKLNNLKAPMPGLVLEVSVEVGQMVAKGDKVLILEAMKMENVLKSPGEGKVKAIKISKGQAVEKGQVLLEFE